MAYQTRQRDPLLDTNMAAALERRSKELLGLALMAAGLAVAMMLGSYVPEDPNWLSSTDAPAQNALGQFGATVANMLYITIGWGAWGISLLLGGWGLRFVLHRGNDRAMSRVIFAPIAVALAAVYASTHVPVSDWTHSFGLGGLFGDTVLGAVLAFLPVGAEAGLRVLAVLSGVTMVWMTVFTLGADKAELRAAARFLLVGAVLSYASIVAVMSRLGGLTARGVKVAGALHQARRDAAQARAEARADERAAAAARHREPVVQRAIPVAEPAPRDDRLAAPPRKASFLARMPILSARAPDPEPELVDAQISDEAEVSAPSDERIRNKINDVIRSRTQRPKVLEYQERAEPPIGAEAASVPPAPRLNAGADHADTPPEPVFTRRRAAAPAPAAERKVVQPAATKSAVPSRRARAEAQPAFEFEEKAEAYAPPPLSLLTPPTDVVRTHLSDEALEENARMLENVLDDYGVKGEIVSVRPGPVVTMYELEPAPGLKASRVIGLADDIARSMSALSARVSTVPGRSVIGIELPNATREKVLLREILSSRDFGDGTQRLPLALGKDIGGESVVANLSKMPHLLIAGTTGSGKSVAINTMILSLLYKLSPDECRLIMIDPKMLELSVYDGIPHLLSPVVTDPKKAVAALKWVVGEMEERYRKMSKMGVRNIDGYNGRVKEALSRGEMFSRTVQTGFDDETGDPVFETEEFAPEAIPYIVVIVDEMADLMMVAGKEIEACIQRLAQMARASGIHLIMATQRPSVDVITGTIKANFPTRISFQVTSKVDSRTILGEQGAEQLLGMGDMLYMAGGGRITRIHGPFVSDEEVEEVVASLKAYGPPEYVGGVVDGPDNDTESDIDLVLGLGGNTDSEDALYDQAVAIVVKDRKCSTSYIQRKLAIGYNKAARLVEQMEDAGLVSAANHVGKREILVPEQQ
ncbi:DNA translocase FtsK [Maritimibacter sp. 55A14]|uniref:DNA translocase FtsK n=1 Tax=Maritimibacter sp. 55A14 TaxID=2174844 RepID=UPI000D6139F6|nr:DNA translocase FtsK [Maritimibacter sp. 55A14]PWE33509.1 DNA translocase FtsK [Maritimibacter sp. 55A14]